MATVFIALGSNLGDRAANLHRALAALAPVLHVERISGLYETEPWGVTDQPWFYNLVIAGTTGRSPAALLDDLKAIERATGRRETVRYGPRLIDLDLLFYEQLVIETNRLTLPHPRLHERRFVLRPLAEIAPDLIHPRLQTSVRDLLARLRDTDRVCYLGEFSQ